MELVVQFAIIFVWSGVFAVHIRRLFRLAQVEWLPVLRNRAERQRLSRVWWWLGREEFWRSVQEDCARGVQFTLMVFLFAWGFHW